MVCIEERKGTSLAQPDGTGVLLARAESPPALGEPRSAPPPGDSAGPGPAVPAAPGHRAQLPAAAAKAFVRALPVRGRGSLEDPRLGRDEPGQPRREKSPCQPQVPSQLGSGAPLGALRAGPAPKQPG